MTLASAHIVDRGSGPALVLSHGTLMDRTMFAAQVEALSGRHRVVAYDHRARTDRWQGPYSLDDLADDCVRLLDELGIERCVLGGMSMGGFMAIPLALRHPDRLDGLALIATMAGGYPPGEVAEIEAMLARLVERETVSREIAEWERDLVMGATTRRERPELVEAWMERWMTRRSEAVHWEFRSWMHKPDMTERLAEVDLPALVLHGTEDVVLPIERARTMAAALPRARMVEIERAGHTLTVEAPDAVNAVLAEFLAEVHGAERAR